MSNSKTAISEIKKLMRQFGFLGEDNSLKSFKSEDNTIYQLKALEIGAEVFHITDQFEKVAFEKGNVIFNDGFRISVKNGKIVSVKQLFADAKLKDGTVIRIDGDAPAEGSKVTIVTADGEIPAPDGIHELEDGSEIHTKDGEIVMIEPAAEEVGESPADEAQEGEDDEEKPGQYDKRDVNPHPNPADVNKDAQAPGSEVMNPDHKELLDLVHGMVQKVHDKLQQMESEMGDMKSQFSAFKKEPAGKRIPNGKTDLINNNFSADDNKIKAIMELRKANK